jgi:hypothetical protein
VRKVQVARAIKGTAPGRRARAQEYAENRTYQN